jgi:predicted secreted protein
MAGKVVFVPHCILNPAVRDGSTQVKEVIKLFAESGIGIVQLPCPEIEYNGKLVKGIRCNKKYREYCKKISMKVLRDVKNYIKADYKVLGILGVEFSNTCGVHQVHKGRKNVPGKGVFMKELENGMQKENFQVPILATNFGNIFSTIEKMSLLIKNS